MRGKESFDPTLTQERHDREMEHDDDIGESSEAPEMDKIGSGTPCHIRGTACHDFCKALKNKGNSTVSKFAPKTPKNDLFIKH